MRRGWWLALVLLAGCAPLEDPSPVVPRREVRPRAPFVAPPGFETLRFGLVPYLTPESLRATHEPLATHLSKALHVPVELQLGESYGAAIDRLVSGESDLVELSAFAYALASERMKPRCIAQEIADGSLTAAGYVFVRDDSPRRTLAELQGASIAYVDPDSTLGYRYPKRLLESAGVKVSREVFVGNHEAVLLAVQRGDVEAGATYQGAFAALKNAKGVDPLTFRVVAKTPRSPHDVLCVRPDLPEPVVDELRTVLFSLTTRDRQGREILGPLNVNGFHAPDESSYDAVKRLARETK